MKAFLLGILSLIVIVDGVANAAPPQIVEASVTFLGFDPTYDGGAGLYVFGVNGIATDDPLGPRCKASIVSPIGSGAGNVDQATGAFYFRMGIRAANLPAGNFYLPIRAIDLDTREVSQQIPLLFPSPLGQ